MTNRTSGGAPLAGGIPLFSRARVVACLVAAVVGLLVFSVLSGVTPAPPRASAATPPAGEVSNEPIAASELLSGAAPEGLTANARFAPPKGARKARQPFGGTLHLDGAPMTMLAGDPNSQPKPSFTSNPILGKDTTYFPEVSLSFFTYRNHLVPTTQDVVRNGALLGTRSYWDMIVQPGRVWHDPADRRWNRAAFPFALVNSLEQDTHSGLATFLYKGSKISAVRFQIVQQTAPWYVRDYFSAWGVTEANYQSRRIANQWQRKHDYKKELGARLPVAPWSSLPQEVSGDPLVQAFTQHPDDNPDVIASAVVRKGVLYRSECRTAAGPYPYCDEMRNGVWSATKSAMLNVATMRVAQKFGSGILEEPIADYLPAASRPGWEDVTFRDMANMASGHGHANDEYDPTYACWYESRTQSDKTEEALASPREREPGTLFQYRDRDAYLLGVALDALLKSKKGPGASVWKMIRREVYRPIGIHHAPSVSTIEEDGSEGHPLLAWGYLATLDDLAKIGLLYQAHGAWGGRQILHRGLVDSLLPTDTTPEMLPAGSGGYHLNWWFRKVGTTWVARMAGFGGNTVALLPSKLVTVKIGNTGVPEDGWPAEWPISNACALSD